MSALQFKQINWDSDIGLTAKYTNPVAVNTWGVAKFKKQIFVANNGAASVSIYNRKGVQIGLINVPSPADAPGTFTGTPTGLAINRNNSAFLITPSNVPALLLIATEDGTVLGWSPALPNPSAAVILVNTVATPLTPPTGNTVNSVFKGLDVLQSGSISQLYVADFRFGFVRVFDANFNLINSFTDTNITTGVSTFGEFGTYAPFNVYTDNCSKTLIVSFALQDALAPAAHDDVAGDGNGYIDQFSEQGSILKRLVSRDNLNSPWGMQILRGGTLLVGNFGSGEMLTYNLKATNGASTQVLNRFASELVIDGLWGILLVKNVVFFAAGINKETDGLFGALTPVGSC